MKTSNWQETEVVPQEIAQGVKENVESVNKKVHLFFISTCK